MSEQRLVKLARTSMRSYAHRLHNEQGGKCPLCGEQIDLTIKGEGVIDHDHNTGQIRGLLHRACNAAEGKVAHAIARWGGTGNDYNKIVPFMARLVSYLQQPKKPLIYPTHKTEDERRLVRSQRAKEARAARNARIRMQREKKQ